MLAPAVRVATRSPRPAAETISSQQVWTQWNVVSPLLPAYTSGEVTPNRCAANQNVIWRIGHSVPRLGNEKFGNRISPPTMWVAKQ